ncbi:arylesterase [Lacisediminimonas profundi]|uniref:arylesterase n=1 Tax=Lacisediminimonas profundi TaxID=2603856 RepID=UPI003BAB7FBD
MRFRVIAMEWRCALVSLLLMAGLLMQGSVAHSASKTVLVLGDSVSAEYGLARGAGWVALLEKRLAANKINATVVNASISGETTSGGRSRLGALLQKHRPQILILELGGNDGLRGLTMESTEANLRAMIALAKKAKAAVLLVGMQIPPNYGADYTRRFAGLYPKLAKENKLALVPFLFEGLKDDAQMFQPDRIHPTAQAQAIMLDNVWPHLKPLLR